MMSETKLPPYALILPFPTDIAGRMLASKTVSFAKFQAHGTVSDAMKSLKKVLIYGSGESKCVFGEGAIMSIRSILVNNILDPLPKNFFLSREEFKTYCGERIYKRVLLFFLKNLSHFEPPLLWRHAITMTGRYLSKEEYNSFIQSEW